jgi:hypothetical protein
MVLQPANASLETNSPSLDLKDAVKHYSSVLLYRGGFSLILGPSYFQAFMLPLFLPVLTSLRLAKQQQRLSWMIQARTAVPAAIHMKANISTSIEALMFNCWTCVMAFCIMTN